MKLINKTRHKLYRSASILGDVNAIISGSPKKIAKRFGRKVVGKQSGKTIRTIFR